MSQTRAFSVHGALFCHCHNVHAARQHAAAFCSGPAHCMSRYFACHAGRHHVSCQVSPEHLISVQAVKSLNFLVSFCRSFAIRASGLRCLMPCVCRMPGGHQARRGRAEQPRPGQAGAAGDLHPAPHAPPEHHRPPRRVLQAVQHRCCAVPAWPRGRTSRACNPWRPVIAACCAVIPSSAAYQHDTLCQQMACLSCRAEEVRQRPARGQVHRHLPVHGVR